MTWCCTRCSPPLQSTGLALRAAWWVQEDRMVRPGLPGSSPSPDTSPGPSTEQVFSLKECVWHRHAEQVKTHRDGTGRMQSKLLWVAPQS